MVTTSVPTTPEAPVPSAYWIDQLAPDMSCQVELWLESKTLWPCCEAESSRVENTHLCHMSEQLPWFLISASPLTDPHFPCQSRDSGSARQWSLGRNTQHPAGQ